LFLGFWVKENWMPEITVEEIADAPVEVVYAIAKEIERFPEWMSNVDSITVLSRDGNRVTSKWLGRVEEFKRNIRWTEEDIWEDANHRCLFRATEGDWETYEGEWSFIPEGDQTRLRLRLNFDINVPLIGALIKGLLTKLTEKNSRDMLKALAARAQAATNKS
jgi:ribosome-associated toxin RatA of RatAB toxin-antitoxin module